MNVRVLGFVFLLAACDSEPLLATPDLGVAAGDGAAPVDAGIDASGPTEPLGESSTVYAPSSLDNELLAYNRVIRLAHAGSANGRLLAVFEHEMADRSPAPLMVRTSTDEGRTWSTL